MTPEQPDKLEVGEKDEAGKTKLEAAESGPQGVCNCPPAPCASPETEQKEMLHFPACISAGPPSLSPTDLQGPSLTRPPAFWSPVSE